MALIHDTIFPALSVRLSPWTSNRPDCSSPVPHRCRFQSNRPDCSSPVPHRCRFQSTDFKQTGLLKSCTSSLSVSVQQTGLIKSCTSSLSVRFSPRTSNRPDCSSPVPHRCRFQSTDFRQTGLLKSCTPSLSVSVQGLQTDRTAQVLYPIVVGFSPRTSNRLDCSIPVPHRCGP